jgi:predicted DsbA family dithiol-disulfide isomerase
MTAVIVYADIVCPFAYIGLTRLLQRRDELGRPDVHLQIRSWPLEIVNGKPVDGAFIGEEIDEIKPQVAQDLFAGFKVSAFPASTLPGLAVTASAYDIDDATGESVAMELRRLVFEHGVNIDDHSVIEAVAARHGMTSLGTVDAVMAEYQAGKARHVVGSPHFFIGDKSMFCPTLNIKRVDGVLQVEMDVEAFQALVAHCFA